MSRLESKGQSAFANLSLSIRLSLVGDMSRSPVPVVSPLYIRDRLVLRSLVGSCLCTKYDEWTTIVRMTLLQSILYITLPILFQSHCGLELQDCVTQLTCHSVRRIETKLFILHSSLGGLQLPLHRTAVDIKPESDFSQ